MSHVRCQVSGVTFFLYYYFFFTKGWNYLVEGLLSTGPIPSSFGLKNSIAVWTPIMRQLNSPPTGLPGLLYKHRHNSSLLQPIPAYFSIF